MDNNKRTDFSVDPPVAFAIMKNAHEAFRGAIIEMADVLGGPDEDKPAFIKLWKDYQRAGTVHMDMEEIDMFPLLEKVSEGSVSNAGLSDAHVADHELSYDIDENISASTVDWSAVKTAFFAWREAHIEHFGKEEAVMMPLTLKTATTPEGRCLVVHDKLVTPADARDSTEFKNFIGFCVAKLSRFGSNTQPPNVATRVFVRALRSACLKIQWQKFMPVCKANCTADIWAEMVDKYHMEDADDAHLIPVKLSRAIQENNLDDFPRVPSPSPSEYSPSKPNTPKSRPAAKQQEFYECKCSIM